MTPGQCDDRAWYPGTRTLRQRPEFVAKDLRQGRAYTGVKTLFIEPGSPWESGRYESFNGKLCYEFQNGESFCSLKAAKVLAECWLVYYNIAKPYSSLGYRPLAPATWHVESKRGMEKYEAKSTCLIFTRQTAAAIYLAQLRATRTLTPAPNIGQATAV